MQQRIAILIGVVAVALVAVSGVVAQNPGPGHDGRGPRGFGGMARALELTEDQQAAAREIFDAQRPEREALHEEMRENRSALREALESAPPDALLVGELVIQGEALKARGRALRDQSREALEDVLSDEQKQKLDLLEAMDGGWGRGGRTGRRGAERGPAGRGAEPE